MSLIPLNCNTNHLPTYTQLGDLRILTLIATPPEALPGQTIALTPVLSDLNGQGRTLTYSVEACMDPGVSRGVQPQCQNPDSTNQLSGTTTLPAGTSQTYTGSIASLSITLPQSSIAFAAATPAMQYNGTNYLIFYTLSASAGNSSVRSFVRVTLSTKTPQNQNPILTSINRNDTPILSIFQTPEASTNFNITIPSSSFETYSILKNDGSLISQTETLSSTWFISDGSFNSDLTIGSDENSWTPPSPKPTSRGSVILVVTTDSRYGAAFQKIEMN